MGVPSSWAALSALAADQCGVFSRTQARKLGLSNYRLARGVARQELVLESRDVFRLAGAPGNVAVRDWVAWLRSGSGAVMAAWSAARQHGLDSPLSAPCGGAS